MSIKQHDFALPLAQQSAQRTISQIIPTPNSKPKRLDQSILDPIKTDVSSRPTHLQILVAGSLTTVPTNKPPSKTQQLSTKARQANTNSTENSNQSPVDTIPGQLTEGILSPKIPDWYKIGWAAQIESVVDLSKSDQDELKHLDILETFLSEVYYGTWFHNAAVIFFAVAASTTSHYSGEDGLHSLLSSAELAKQRLFQDHETVDWLNNFLNRFWLIYEPVLSATIVASVDQILVASTPSFLESIRISHPETENDVVVMDWKFDFTPNDISDLTAKVAASKINPKIVLTIRIRIKLMNAFPHLQLIDLSFLEKPEFDFVLKPVGFDLNMIPGLSGFIESQVHATLGPMMYDPNVFTLNLEQMLAGALVDSAVGVLQITVANAQGLKAYTESKLQSVHFLLIHSLNEILTMEIMDYNEVRKDTSIGTASIDLQTLVTEPEQESLTIPIMHQGKPRGEIRLSMAKELDYKRSGTSNLSSYAKIYLNGQQILKTPVIKRTNNPVWEAFTGGPKIGTVTVKLADLLELTTGEQKLDWFPLVGAKSGKLRLSAVWKGVMMAGAINGASAYTPPIGVLRFHFDKAEDLKNNNDLDPVFDEIIYVPVHSLKDSFRLEVMDYQQMTKDRPLGHIDLETNKLIESSKEEGRNTYKSTGKHQFSEYLKQEGKKALVKGKMHFTVEFYPCKPIKFDRFQSPSSDVDKMKNGQISDKASIVNSLDNQSITLVNPEAAQGLTNGKSLTNIEATTPTTKGYDVASIDGSPRSRKLDLANNVRQTKHSMTSLNSHHLKDDKSLPPLIELSKDELLASQSGILVFNIIGGVIARKHARLEFLFDDGYWPSYSTEPSKSTHPKWDETGESFIRELDWSRCILKLNVADKDTREEVYAEYTCDLKAFMNDCLDGPHDFVLQDLEGGNRSTISIQCRYIPVPITLEPRESINSEYGLLTVFLDHAKDLMAADRNGYSDPYAQFVLNGAKVFKSSVQKKTLNPKWTERFDVEIPSRAAAEFYVNVYDWDRVGTSDKLGQGRIDLSNIEPMIQSTVLVNLSQGR
ncbi:hypothetical protein KEM48_005698 [Puccinia striiformis f. sp. tritici PST-130]|nr:hypothetical protein KEM48_005698 [Puccinia striiformis f. sp. tritici PST-130]